ncbi:homoprotocatechuate degradation operon regulator HpaR [Roseicitreum antarcticum]|uniref:Homoprotocatechuate degradation operon regulator, HpaR n=1 Tax=Roseicitreum antarcticum TaxID=564137 RepID=A0A1H3C5H9_9RHOB|nr:homoprotocatechuate degradation operon regulator HpaR [Roseicitreum antarcticum]SDX49351.1 homoprotocatechuate degradation operon regulator, HpaR [Roseicitreum antarcticum]
MTNDTPTDGTLRGFEQSLPIALLRARDVTSRRFKPYLDDHDLTMPQWSVMRALADAGPLDAKTLSERCVILPPSLTRIFRTLAAKGLTEAIESQDARRHTVQLTPQGRALFETMVRQAEATYAELEHAFGRDRMLELLNLLSDLRRTTEALPPVR